ncbi:Ribosomal protein S21 family protein [Abeliophyllum distichum]|uniref:Ribosomal protein S21 family protein n=2 Tax=Forsythieae TaxID=426104 RepID=A0ABD1P8Y6_9LAMI
MNAVAKRVATLLLTSPRSALASVVNWELQQWRGIRVKVRNNNLEQALTLLQRKMQSSGIERMIKNEQTHHIKNSEKRVLAKKNLERKIRGQDLARKLKAILVKKVRGL